MTRHRRLLCEFVSLPTAPFHEAAGIDFIRSFVARRPALSMRVDSFGNLLVTYRGRARRGPRRRPLVLAGHLDHPGFVARSMVGRDLIADFQGWVDRDYFRGAKVRFFTPTGEVRGTIVEVDPGRPESRSGNADRRPALFRNETPPEAARIRVPRAVPTGTIGMWDFPGARLVGDLLQARACDDVAGVSAILAALDELCRTKADGECMAFFTRAEEVGFAGALAAVDARVLPRHAIIVAVECSRAITGVAMGGGPVLRVGDKASVFTPAATAWCQIVADELAARDQSFAYQRKLMDGGTCESTAYCHYGYDATGICLPLLNYHNMDRERHRIAPEMIDLRDFDRLVRWFVALATTRTPFVAVQPALARRLRMLLMKHRARLRKTASAVAPGSCR